MAPRIRLLDLPCDILEGILTQASCPLVKFCLKFWHKKRNTVFNTYTACLLTCKVRLPLPSLWNILFAWCCS